MESLLNLIEDAYNKVKEVFSTVINGKCPFYVEWDKQNFVNDENNSDEDSFSFISYV